MTEATSYCSAEQLLAEYSLTHGRISAPIDISRIIEFLGIDVESSYDFHDSEIIGQITFTETGKAKILINELQNTYEARRRFTLAHEIGHYCLHSKKSNNTFIDTKKTMSRSESYWDKYESEANSFAAELLMPKELIIKESIGVIESFRTRYNKDKIPFEYFIDQMADKFSVSNQAMIYRLKNLGIKKYN